MVYFHRHKTNFQIKTGEESEPGIDGGKSKIDNAPDLITSVTIDIKSIDNVIQQIQDFSGEITQQKMSIPGVGWFAQFKDTERQHTWINARRSVC